MQLSMKLTGPDHMCSWNTEVDKVHVAGGAERASRAGLTVSIGEVVGGAWALCVIK